MHKILRNYTQCCAWHSVYNACRAQYSSAKYCARQRRQSGILSGSPAYGGWVKSHEVTATGRSEIPLTGGAGGLEGSSLSQKDVWGVTQKAFGSPPIRGETRLFHYFPGVFKLFRPARISLVLGNDSSVFVEIVSVFTDFLGTFPSGSFHEICRTFAEKAGFHEPL